MATGFAAIQRNTITSTSGYKTLFEKITEKTKGEKKTFSWYRAAVKSEASSYKKNFDNYKDPIGREIFKMFAIDKVEFANIFNNYGKYKGKKVDVTGKCNKRSIENLLQYAIGYGYWMVHAKGNKLDMFEVTESYMKKSAKLTGRVVLHYGGARGSGKRLDIHCESSNYKFMFNLRNKQRGLYPSHIMCDYKKK